MRNSVNTIKELLEWKGSNGEKAEEYDFKRNMRGYYEDPKYLKNIMRKLEERNISYENFINGMPYGTEKKSNIEEWLAYRTADAVLVPKEKGETKILLFDCDNSNTTCTLTRLIYVWLWNWGMQKEDKSSQPLKAFDDKAFGGDTMNSFATTFNKYMETMTKNAMSTAKIADMFSKTGAEFWHKEMEGLWESWDRFARNTQCIGNFILVPYYFNRFRYNKTEDYWDLSLDLLRNKRDGEVWEVKEKLMVDWDSKDFNRYINLFFLWDYVDCVKDENGKREYRTRQLFTREKNEILPQTGGTDQTKYVAFKEFLDNVNHRIERRSRFMVALLKIASGTNSDGKPKYKYCGEHQEEWNVSGIYKKFMEEIFLKKDAVYNGYGEVIDEMKVVAEGTSEEGWINGILNGLLKDLHEDLS